MAPGLAAAGVTWARVGEVATVKGVAEKPMLAMAGGRTVKGMLAEPAGSTTVRGPEPARKGPRR